MAKLESSLILSLIDRVSAPARQVSATISRLNQMAASNRQAIADMQGQMLGAVGAGYALYRGLAAPVTAAVGFESAMADIAKVTDFSKDGLSAYGRELRGLATSEIPMAVTELAALSENAAAAGIAQQDLLGFTRLTAKAALAWGMGGAEAGQDLANIKTALGLTIAETERYADAINHLADNTASSAPALIGFSKEVAVQGEFFGFTKEQTLAFGSAMISSGADANVAATSFRNMGRALTKGSSATKRQMDAFKKLGMNATKVAAAMQDDAVGTTMEVIEAIGKLPQEMQAAAISDLFGDEARALIPLLGNTEALREALGFVSDELAYTGSVGAEFEKRAATTEFAIQRFKNQVHDLGITVGNILLPPLNDFLAVAGPLAMRIAELAEANPELTRNVLAAAGGLIAFRVAATGLKFLGLVGKGGIIDLMSIAFRGLVDPAKSAGKAVGSMLAYQAAMAGMSGVKYSGFAKMVDGAKALALAAPGMGAAKAVLGGIAGALGLITLPVAAGIAAVAAAGVLIYKYWDRISSFVSGFASAIGKELQPALDAVKPILDWFVPLGDAIGAGWNAAKSALEGVGGLISGMFAQEQLTEEQKAAFAPAGADLANRMVQGFKDAWDGIYALFAGVAQKILDAIGTIDLSGLFKIPDLGAMIRGKLGEFGIGGGDTSTNANGTVRTVPGPKPVGQFAKGGRFSSGLALVGEEGPELVEFGGPGNVHTTAETRGIFSGAAGSGGHSFTFGNIVLQNPVNASPDQIAAAFGRELRDLFSSIQTDTGHRIA